MQELHKKMTTEDLSRIMWCAKLALHLEGQGWTFLQGWEYAEVLHFDYVELGDWDVDPIEALEEDMTYWGD